MVKIEVVKEENYQFIQVIGEIDASTSIELDDALKAVSTSGSPIIVNLEGLDYISSAGLGVFISYIEEFKTNNIEWILYGLQPTVKEVFEILGLNQIMKITLNKEDALSDLNES